MVPESKFDSRHADVVCRIFLHLIRNNAVTRVCLLTRAHKVLLFINVLIVNDADRARELLDNVIA